MNLEDLAFVFSTGGNANIPEEEEDETTVPKKEQRMKVYRDSKKRRGKVATIVTGFEGSDDELKALAKYLKSKCGVGGSAKDGEIIVQGNWKEKVHSLLVEKGYTQTRMSGG